MKTSLTNRLRILLDVFAIIPIRPLLNRREFWLELKRGGRAQVQTEMVEFIASPFTYSRKLKMWSFYVVVVQGQQRNVQNSVITCKVVVLLIKPIVFFDVLLAVAVVVS